MISLINYTEENRNAIKDLNYEWLQKYFTVEPVDAEQLSDPKTHIIDKGGKIYYALYDGIIIGTATLLNKGNKVYELGKMAITAAYQGKGIANMLMQHCIDEAVKLGGDKIILYSNSKLVPAINLYRKFGFQDVPLDASVYARSDTKMELDIRHYHSGSKIS